MSSKPCIVFFYSTLTILSLPLLLSRPNAEKEILSFRHSICPTLCLKILIFPPILLPFYQTLQHQSMDPSYSLENLAKCGMTVCDKMHNLCMKLTLYIPVTPFSPISDTIWHLDKKCLQNKHKLKSICGLLRDSYSYIYTEDTGTFFMIGRVTLSIDN